MRSSAPGRMSAGQLVEKAPVDQPPLDVPLLRPGVGKEDEDPLERRVRQVPQQLTGILGAETDVGEAAFLDRRQRLDDAVLEYLAADEADIGIGIRLPDEVLAAAKADLQPGAGGGHGEQLGERCWQRLTRGKRHARQHGIEQLLLARTQLAPAAATERAQLLPMLAVRRYSAELSRRPS